MDIRTLHLFGSYIAEIEALTDVDACAGAPIQFPRCCARGQLSHGRGVAPLPTRRCRMLSSFPHPNCASGGARLGAQHSSIRRHNLWDTETTGTNVFHAEIAAMLTISAVQYPYNQLLYRHILSVRYFH